MINSQKTPIDYSHYKMRCFGLTTCRNGHDLMEEQSNVSRIVYNNRGGWDSLDRLSCMD